MTLWFQSRHRRFLAEGFAFLLGLALPSAFAQSPSWWTSRGVVETNAMVMDYAPAIQAQLKWIATNAADEVEAALPGGAGTSVWNLVAGFSPSNNYLGVNVGQVKALAEPFYDRLIEVGYTANYPWTPATSDDVDYALANIGQVKYAFSFDPRGDQDTDGLPDWWETLYGLGPSPESEAHLVGWWRLEESAGPAVADSSSCNNPGTACNMDPWPVVVGYPAGQALGFDPAKTSRIQVACSASLMPTSAITVAAWVFLDSWGTWGFSMVLSKGLTDYTSYVALYGVDSGALCFDVNGAAQASQTLSTGSWVHVAGVFDGTNATAYVNAMPGTPAGGAGEVPALTNDWTIGAYLDDGFDGYHFDGSIADVRIYNSALSPADITNLVQTAWDLDLDGLANSNEYWHGTCPTNSDTDADGLDDGEEVALGTDPANPNSFPVTLSGVVSYSGLQTGQIHVVVVTGSNSWSTARSAVLMAPSSYCISNLPNLTTYWIKAWRDSDGDGSNDAWEACGTYVGSPLTPTTNAVGLAIALGNPSIDSDWDGLPDWWEIYYGLNPYVGISENRMGWWYLEESDTTFLGTLVDHSGRGHDGAASTSLWPKATAEGYPAGRALVFESAADQILVTSHADFCPTSALSITAWTYLTNMVLESSILRNESAYHLGVEGGYVIFEVCTNTAQWATLVAPYPGTGQWVQVTAVYDGAVTNMTVYLNGSNVASQGCAASILTSSSNLTIGCSAGLTNQPLRGYLGPLAFYTEALSADAAGAIAESSGPGPCGRSWWECWLNGWDPSAVPGVAILMSSGSQEVWCNGTTTSPFWVGIELSPEWGCGALLVTNQTGGSAGYSNPDQEGGYHEVDWDGVAGQYDIDVFWTVAGVVYSNTANCNYTTGYRTITVTPYSAIANGSDNVPATFVMGQPPGGGETEWVLEPSDIANGATLEPDAGMATVIPGHVVTNYVIRAHCTNHECDGATGVVYVVTPTVNIVQESAAAAVSHPDIPILFCTTTGGATNVSWSISPAGLEQGASFVGSTHGTNVSIRSGSIVTTYTVTAQAAYFPSVTDTAQIVVHDVYHDTTGSRESVVGDPVEIISGGSQRTERDVAISCPHFPLVFSRVYCSRLDNPDSILGPGWTHTYDVSLGMRTNYTFKGIYGDYWKVLSLGDGHEEFFLRQGDGSYATGVEWNLSLTALENGYRVTAPGPVFQEFDAAGVLQVISNLCGGSLTLTWSGAYPEQRLLRVESGNGLGLDFAYGAAGLLSQVATPDAGFYVSYAYNDDGELTGATRHTSLGDTTSTSTYAYDGQTHSMTQRVNAVGEPATMAYVYTTNSDGQAIAKCSDTSVGVQQYYRCLIDYSAATGGQVQVTYIRDGRSLVESNAFDVAQAKLTNTIFAGGDATRTIRRDSALNITNEMLESSGHRLASQMAYDACHNITNLSIGYDAKSTNPWKWTWDPASRQPSLVEDPEGARIGYDYANSLLTRIRLYTNATGSADTLLGYTGEGLLSGMTNANGHWVRYFYDEYGRVAQVQPQTGLTVVYTNNVLGYVTALVVGGNRLITLEPDELGRVQSIAYPDGLSESFVYDALGNLTNHVDRGGRATSYTYLPTRKLSSVSRMLGTTNVITSVAYDQQFNTLHITDPLGRAVEAYVLDDQDRVTTVTNLEGQTMSVTYVLGDMVSQVTRFDGTAVSNAYGSAGWLERVVYPDGESAFVYRQNGLLLAASNETCIASNLWDAANRLTRVDIAGLCDSELALDYQYDPVGSVTERTGVGVTNGWTYDEAERWASQSSTRGGLSPLGFTWSYNEANGLVGAVQCTNTGVSVSNRYDVMDRVTNITWKKDGSILAEFGYLYDNDGMVTQRVMAVDGAATTQRYGYDELFRLVTEAVSGSVTSTVSFTYDLVGNRSGMVRDGVPTLYEHAAGGNRLIGWGFEEYEGYYFHDDAGCVTSLVYSATQRLDLAWNGQYQVTEVRTSATTVVERHGYDFAGRRAWTWGSDGATTNYLLYDGAQVVAELDRAGGLRRAYTYGPGIDNPLAMTVYTGTTAKTYFYLSDHLGTVHAVADESGSIVESYRYDAWGRVLGVYDGAGTPLTQSAIGNRILFQGREYSWATGLYHFRARWYDPVTGRWLSNDPIGISGGLNQYVFCGNSPVNMRDPMGLVTWQWGEGTTIRQANGAAAIRQQVTSTDAGRALWNVIAAGPDSTVITVYPHNGTGGQVLTTPNGFAIRLPYGSVYGAGHELGHLAEEVSRRIDPANLGLVSSFDTDRYGDFPCENRAVRAGNIVASQWALWEAPIPTALPPVTTYRHGNYAWTIPEPYGTRYQPPSVR